MIRIRESMEQQWSKLFYMGSSTADGACTAAGLLWLRGARRWAGDRNNSSIYAAMCENETNIAYSRAKGAKRVDADASEVIHTKMSR